MIVKAKKGHYYYMRGQQRTRELVRIRDNHTCQKCFKKWQEETRRFDVHHLNGLCGKVKKGYDKVGDIDGLVTLCKTCHVNLPSVMEKKINGIRKYYRIPDGRDEKIVELKNVGNKSKIIANMFGITNDRVNQILREARVLQRRRR